MIGEAYALSQKMKRVIHCATLIVALSVCCSAVCAQMQRKPYAGRETWHEFLLKQFNPRDVDYGGWLEKRRQAFLEATVREPHFWYSLSATTGLLFALVAYTKLCLDHRRRMRITAEMMADIYTHDLYSRQSASEAIEKYNRHIEQCNRAIEAAESGDDRPVWDDTATESLKAELQRVAAQLEATAQDRNKLQEELRQKALIVADLSTRLDNLARKVNGSRDIGSISAASAPGDENGDGARFVGQINRLQEELYERKSITHKFSVGGHEGYIIVGMYAEGAPGEIFIKMAKEGSTLSGFMDGLALSISIGLQYGVPLKALVDKLTNTRFEPSGFTENPSIRYASSVLDYIARWLGGKFLSPQYLKPRAAVSEQELVIQTGTRGPTANTRDTESIPPGNGGTNTGDAPSCSTCGMLMVPNGSCYKCVNCGGTSGCS